MGTGAFRITFAHACLFSVSIMVFVQITTWLDLNNWLMPNGRIMVNCGGTSRASEVDPKSSSNGFWVQNSMIEALAIVFPGQVRL